MKTKAQIVQRLLEEKKIDAEEAVILLMTDKEYVPVAQPYPYPIYPAAPFQPFWYVDPRPYVTYCATSNEPGITVVSRTVLN